MVRNWYRLDNAGRVFAALASRRSTTVFRVAVTLREPVDLELLQKALDALMPRFPYFGVRLRTGLFWHYLEEVAGAPTVQMERRAPCRRMTKGDDGPWQFRVVVFDRRISVECSHVLTDGFGGFAFLVALLAEYLTRLGVIIPANERIMRPAQDPRPEEAEDAYRRFYDQSIPPPPLGTRALRLRGIPLPADECRVILGVVPRAPLRDLSHSHDVTLTELLASILLASVADIAGHSLRPSQRINTTRFSHKTWYKEREGVSGHGPPL